MSRHLKIKQCEYTDEANVKRAEARAKMLDDMLDMRGKRVLEIGTHVGALGYELASNYGCDVVGIDIQESKNWEKCLHPRLDLFVHDISKPYPDWEDCSFDRIISFVVWEHIWHPFSALKQCQRILRSDGKKYLRANLYRSAISSHLYNKIPEPWINLLHSPEEIAAKHEIDLGWAFWVNKLTYQQYLFYFRELGMHVTYEKFYRDHFNETVFQNHKKKLDLYPQWDLKTDFFEVVLEFDPVHPKQSIPDPVYRIRKEE